MAAEVGNQVQVAYISEVTFKTTPATPTGKILRFTGFTLAADRNYLENPELRTDRQRTAGRGGVMVGKGEVAGVFSYGTYDDLLEAALGGTWTTNVLKIGAARKSFTFERLHKVNTLSYPFRGVVVDSFELSGRADQNVEAKFGLIAASCGSEGTATIWTSTTAAGTGSVLTTWDGSIKKGGVAIGTVVGWTLKGENGYQEAKVCGSADLYDLAQGTCKITGTMELYFDSNALYTDFRAENTVALQINIGSGTSSSYTIDLTSCKITKFGAPSTADGLVSVSVEFESFTHATDTACKVTRIP
jgi:hypothetical protein